MDKYLVAIAHTILRPPKIQNSPAYLMMIQIRNGISTRKMHFIRNERIRGVHDICIKEISTDLW